MSQSGKSLWGFRNTHDAGQATVELAVAMPVLLLTALICYNTLTFISDCSAFDRVLRNSVRVHAVSPGYGVGSSAVLAQIEEDLRQAFPDEKHDVQVSTRTFSYGLAEYEATLACRPTLFGRDMRDELFGIRIPRAVHTERYVVDPYRPGVLL